MTLKGYRIKGLNSLLVWGRAVFEEVSGGNLSAWPPYIAGLQNYTTRSGNYKNVVGLFQTLVFLSLGDLLDFVYLTEYILPHVFIDLYPRQHVITFKMSNKTYIFGNKWALLLIT